MVIRHTLTLVHSRDMQLPVRIWVQARLTTYTLAELLIVRPSTAST